LRTPLVAGFGGGDTIKEARRKTRKYYEKERGVSICHDAEGGTFVEGKSGQLPSTWGRRSSRLRAKESCWFGTEKKQKWEKPHREGKRGILRDGKNAIPGEVTVAKEAACSQRDRSKEGVFQENDGPCSRPHTLLAWGGGEGAQGFSKKRAGLLVEKENCRETKGAIGGNAVSVKGVTLAKGRQDLPGDIHLHYYGNLILHVGKGSGRCVENLIGV